MCSLLLKHFSVLIITNHANFYDLGMSGLYKIHNHMHEHEFCQKVRLVDFQIKMQQEKSMQVVHASNLPTLCVCVCVCDIQQKFHNARYNIIVCTFLI